MESGFLKVTSIVFILSFNTGWAQFTGQKYYERSEYSEHIEDLRELNDRHVFPENDGLELAAQLALLHFPELKGNRIKIKYKKRVRHPITASWAPGNIFRLRKKHIYVLLIHPRSYLTRLDLNGQIGMLGHEMAHFAYYKEHPGIHMLWWGLKYLASKKFRLKFEREADFMAVDHSLGWQMLESSFYTNKEELKTYMELSGY